MVEFLMCLLVFMGNAHAHTHLPWMMNFHKFTFADYHNKINKKKPIYLPISAIYTSSSQQIDPLTLDFL